MKTLLIMRHAKSSRDNPDLADFERPLNSVGLQTAQSMGNMMYKHEIKPNLIISSPAKRAKQTAILVKAAAGIETSVEFIDNLYEASPTTLLNVAFRISDKSDAVLLIGHNPGIESFIRFLTGETQKMTAESIAQITLNIEMWSDIDEKCGELEMLLNPEDSSENSKILETIAAF
jgi:phosphohistidine phosphatase